MFYTALVWDSDTCAISKWLVCLNSLQKMWVLFNLRSLSQFQLALFIETETMTGGLKQPKIFAVLKKYARATWTVFTCVAIYKCEIECMKSSQCIAIIL